MYQGSCLCESIRYEIDSDLKSIVNCHCKFCSKAHGAAFATLLFAPATNFHLTAGEESLSKFHIENLNADRFFCSRCGARLYNELPAMGMVSIVVATLNTTDNMNPVAHVNTESKCAWFKINDGLPQFLTVPSPSEFRELLSK
jgi:hypothetical protein